MYAGNGGPTKPDGYFLTPFMPKLMGPPSADQDLSTTELRHGHAVCTLRVHPPTSPCPALSAVGCWSVDSTVAGATLEHDNIVRNSVLCHNDNNHVLFKRDIYMYHSRTQLTYKHSFADRSRFDSCMLQASSNSHQQLSTLLHLLQK